MKKLWYMFSVCVLVLGISTSPQAQPVAGTYISPNDFSPAGDWREMLNGGSEGAIRNIIGAGSDRVYMLTGAMVISAVVDENGVDYVKSTITYMGGTLDLYNNPATPWYNNEDLSEIFNPTLVTMSNQLWVYDDGNIQFELTMTGELGAYPGYMVEIKATYDKSAPYFEIGSPDVVSDALGQVEIIITGPDIVEAADPVVEFVDVDIRPFSCSNQVWVNTRWQRIWPVAILGTESFDVDSIVPETVELMGITPLRWFWRDISAPSEAMIEPTPYYYRKIRRDGFTDLILLFRTHDIVSMLGPVENGDELTLELSAELTDGFLVTGEDVIHIRKKIERPKENKWCKKYRKAWKSNHCR